MKQTQQKKREVKKQTSEGRKQNKPLQEKMKVNVKNSKEVDKPEKKKTSKTISKKIEMYQNCYSATPPASLAVNMTGKCCSPALVWSGFTEIVQS